MAAGTGLPPAWIKFWTVGEGGAEIAWDSPGDFRRCEMAIQAKIAEHHRPPLAPNVIAGLCATLHKMVTGASPGHAAGDHI